ncbi:MAG: serine/threonine-protein kinase [Synechococcales bacterium]|nr:serine/threonine-protein kinase [Synechococcales bacterium]
MLGHVVGGRYQILQHLGGGGFGRTYLAEDKHLPGQPQCVVKQLKPRNTHPQALEVARRLFEREAEVLYLLGNHPQIPRLFAHFEENQEFYLVQEFIDGTVLSREIRRGQTLSEMDTIGLLKEILTILQFVHGQHVIHRDIKPSNLMRRHQDQAIVLIDFGGVKQIGSESSDAEQSSITIAIGSSGYMPNEQLAGKPRYSSDIYSVGMIGIKALTGCSPAQLPEDLRSGEILWRDRAPHTSDEFAHILETMTRYDFRHRYETVEAVIAALDNLTAQSDTATMTYQKPTGKPSRPPEQQDPVEGQASHLPDAVDRATTSSSTELSAHVGLSTLLLNTGQSGIDATAASSGIRDGYLVWYERGDELFQQQRFQRAIPCYEKVLQAVPDDYFAWFKLAMALENVQRHVDAIACYDRVVQLQPEDYLAWFKRGKALEHLQRYEESLASYDRVVQIQPRNYWVWHERGMVLEALKRNEDAISAFDRAVQLKPDFQLAIEHRKRLLRQSKQVSRLYDLHHYDEAIASCNQAIRDQPDNVMAWLMRGMAFENANQYAEAIRSYQQVIRLQRDDHLAWFKCGTLLEKLERYPDAAKAYQEVTRLQPDNYWAWYDWGRVSETLHDYEQALTAYDRAAHLNPNLGEAIAGRKRTMQQLKLICSVSSE